MSALLPPGKWRCSTLANKTKQPGQNFATLWCRSKDHLATLPVFFCFAISRYFYTLHWVYFLTLVCFWAQTIFLSWCSETACLALLKTINNSIGRALIKVHWFNLYYFIFALLVLIAFLCGCSLCLVPQRSNSFTVSDKFLLQITFQIVFSFKKH